MSQRIFGQVLLLVVAASLAVGLVGCGKSGEALPSSPTHETKALNPPDESFARTVGVTTGPVTAQPAKAIAAAAAGGVAIAVEQEDEDGTQIFGVLVKAGKDSEGGQGSHLRWCRYQDRRRWSGGRRRR